MSRSLFLKAGFRWEERRSAEFFGLGLWRRRFSGAKNASRPIVVIPGFGDSSLSWLLYLAPLLPVLRGRYEELVVIDFPGFNGFLADEKACPSMDLLEQAISDTLDELRPHTVMGHSLGGGSPPFTAFREEEAVLSGRSDLSCSAREG